MVGEVEVLARPFRLFWGVLTPLGVTEAPKGSKMRALSTARASLKLLLLLQTTESSHCGRRPPVSPIQYRRLLLRRVATFGALLVLPGERTRAVTGHEDESFDRQCERAGRLFSLGRYGEAEAAWANVASSYPLRSLGWQNLATLELINAASAVKLEDLPATGDVAARLEAAIGHFRKAAALGPAGVDSLALNNEGNALGLLGRYRDALSAYQQAADASPREFESIPRANAALTFLQLGDFAEGARVAEITVRRDPSFVDGFAILAACRWLQGDRLAAEAALRRVCAEPAFCKLYSTTEAVSGRWPPRAIAAWRDFLQQDQAAGAVGRQRAARAMAQRTPEPTQ